MAIIKTLEAKFPSLTNSNLDVTNYDARVVRRRTPVMLILRKLLQFIMLLPLYLVFVTPIILAGCLAWLRLGTKQKELVKKYCSQLWYYPSLCVHKVLEGMLFSGVPVQSPSIDIGCEDGTICRLHFDDAVFDVGMEYVAENLPQNGPYRSVVCGGLPQLPEMSAKSYQTVVLVHVIDHIPSLDESLTSLKKILDKDGLLALSGFSNGYALNFSRLTFGIVDAKRLSAKKGFHHFLMLNQWKEKFSTLGFTIHRIEGFLGGVKGFLWTILHGVFEINGSNDLYYAVNKLGLIPAWFKKFACIPMVSFMVAFFYNHSKTNPCHFYAELRLSNSH